MSTDALKLTITLPLPPAELRPNARPHYMAKARKTAAYREDAKAAGMVAAYEQREVSKTMPWRRAKTQVTFYHRAPARRDSDNLGASLKACWDGLRDAGLLVDDDQLTHLPIVKAIDPTDPRVEIELIRVEDDHGEGP